MIDDDPARWGSELAGHPILVGGLERVTELGDCRVLVCAGSGRARRSIVGRLLELGMGAHRFATVRHPSVDVPTGCTVGEGSDPAGERRAHRGRAGGRHVVAMPGVTLTHDDVVEDYVTLCAGVSLGGEVTVGEAAYLGMNSSVRERTTVGREAVLGMGAALVEDLPDRATWVGVPARPVVRLMTVGV